MPKKRILIFPNTNTLSHFTRALAIAEWLDASGFECHIGISQARRFWASRYHPRCHKILELWEPSGIPFPCLRWFDNEKFIEECIRSQESLINDLKPHLIIGIFDFISSISSRSIPYISINGGCMLPIYKGILGFDGGNTDERREQQKVLDSFWSFGARYFEPSLRSRGLPLVERANQLLVGDFNCIYEIEEICGIGDLPENYRMIGPIYWEGWEDLGENVPWVRENSKVTLYLNSGTLMKNSVMMRGIIDECMDVDARLLVSTGMDGAIRVSDRIFCKPFLSPSQATGISDMVICTGGVGVCYSNLIHGVPSLVIPMQPEQATNGLNIQKAGCGRILYSNIVFVGSSAQYEKAIDRVRFGAILREMLSGTAGFGSIKKIRSALQKYRTRELMVSIVDSVL